MTDHSRPILSLGEAIVDLICECRLAPGESPKSFSPHHGGAPANVASAIARNGAPAALLGGVGADAWGRWLIEGLEADGVTGDWIARLEGSNTPLAIAVFDAAGEPSFQVYGEDVGSLMTAASTALEPALDRCQALVVGSNTMVGESEREVTRRAVRMAGERGLPVLLDPNHRPTRWDDQATAVRFSRELAAASSVIKCNLAEAEMLTGRRGQREAAEGLIGLGPGLAIVTDGAGQVVTAGAASCEFTPQALGPDELVSPLGAGDAFMGAVAAGLSGFGWDLSRVGETLPAACGDAAACCRRWNARP